MSYLFDTTLYDQIYSNISSELMTVFPIQSDETAIEWYRRMLYEYISYIQSKYEPDTLEDMIPTNVNANKKKDTPNNIPFTPANETLFDTNLENALNIMTMDSNFSIYLFITWFPFLMSPDDWVRVCVKIDQSNTPGQDIPFSSIEFEYTITKLKILAINGISLELMKESYFDDLKLNPFLKAIFRIISLYSKGSTIFDYDTISEVAIINLSETDIVTNGYKIGEILWKVKEITKPLFVNEITLKSNLIVENSGLLTVSKGNSEKALRKKFNSRKFIKSTETSDAEKISGIIQTLMISIFRTFYDFDPASIDQNLFNYMFNNGNLVL